MCYKCAGSFFYCCCSLKSRKAIFISLKRKQQAIIFMMIKFHIISYLRWGFFFSRRLILVFFWICCKVYLLLVVSANFRFHTKWDFGWFCCFICYLLCHNPFYYLLLLPVIMKFWIETKFVALANICTRPIFDEANDSLEMDIEFQAEKHTELRHNQNKCSLPNYHTFCGYSTRNESTFASLKVIHQWAHWRAKESFLSRNYFP